MGSTGAAWTTTARITGAYDLFTRVEKPPDSEAKPTVLYEEGSIVVTAEGVSYLATTVIVMLLITMCEFCCCGYFNSESEIHEEVMQGKWDVRLGYATGMSYKHEPPPE